MDRAEFERANGPLNPGDIVKVRYLDHFAFDRVPRDYVPSLVLHPNVLVGQFVAWDDDALRVICGRDGEDTDDETDMGFVVIARTIIELRVVEKVLDGLTRDHAQGAS